MESFFNKTVHQTHFTPETLLFSRLTDADGRMSFDLLKEGTISITDFDSKVRTASNTMRCGRGAQCFRSASYFFISFYLL